MTSTYRPTLQDAGRRIRCVVTAANTPGGIAEAGTGVAMSVPRAWGLAVVGRRITTAQFERLTSGRRAALTFTDARGLERKRISLRPKRPLRRTIPRLPASTYDVCLELTTGALFTGWRECAKAIVDARAATLVGQVRASRRGARFRVRLRGRAPAIGQPVTAVWRSARCRTCGGRRLGGETVTLEGRTSLRSPRSRAGAGCACASRCPSCPARARATRHRRRRSPSVAGRSLLWMATADLTVIALGRPDPGASEYIAAIQRKLAEQDRVKYVIRGTGTSLEGSTADILAVVGELHAGAVRARHPARVHGAQARRAPRQGSRRSPTRSSRCSGA